MNVLFITSNRLGDAVLSTGLLDHIVQEYPGVVQEYPGASVTVVCGALPAPLFEGVPGLKEIITLKKQSWNRHWFRLWTKVVSTKWDMVVDLRDSVISRTVRAKKRHIFGSHIDKKLHKVEQNAAVMGLNILPAPRLWPTEAQQKKARELIPDGGPVLGIGPTANWRGKTWPAERFIALIEKLAAPAGLMPNARVAVFAAPGEEDDARKVLASVPKARQIDIIAKADPGAVAAALARCSLFIGNDSGLMHCAAAAGVSTLGLFGPSWPHLYRPWGLNAAYISTPETFDQLINYPGYDSKTCGCLMNSLTLDAVLAAVRELITPAQKSKAGAF
jgi:lipopolysaccharide export system permease protein